MSERPATERLSTERRQQLADPPADGEQERVRDRAERAGEAVQGEQGEMEERAHRQTEREIGTDS
jgi:hypothetical protein